MCVPDGLLRLADGCGWLQRRSSLGAIGLSSCLTWRCRDSAVVACLVVAWLLLGGCAGLRRCAGFGVGGCRCAVAVDRAAVAAAVAVATLLASDVSVAGLDWCRRPWGVLYFSSPVIDLVGAPWPRAFGFGLAW